MSTFLSTERTRLGRTHVDDVVAGAHKDQALNTSSSQSLVGWPPLASVEIWPPRERTRPIALLSGPDRFEVEEVVAIYQALGYSDEEVVVHTVQA